VTYKQNLLGKCKLS